MDSMEQIEAKLAKVKLIREIEHAMAVLASGQKNGAVIRTIYAEDAAEAERSVHFVFSVEESAEIYKVAEQALNIRHAALKKELESG